MKKPDASTIEVDDEKYEVREVEHAVRMGHATGRGQSIADEERKGKAATPERQISSKPCRSQPRAHHVAATCRSDGNQIRIDRHHEHTKQRDVFRGVTVLVAQNA